MNGKDVLDGFDLHDHLSLDKKIDAISEIYRDSILLDGKDLLGLEWNTEFGQFVRQADAVRLLEKSWPQFGMDAIRGPKDAVGDP